MTSKFAIAGTAVLLPSWHCPFRREQGAVHATHRAGLQRARAAVREGNPP